MIAGRTHSSSNGGLHAKDRCSRTGGPLDLRGSGVRRNAARHSIVAEWPSAEDLKAATDMRIEMTKIALQLTPAQEKLWPPVEEQSEPARPRASSA